MTIGEREIAIIIDIAQRGGQLVMQMQRDGLTEIRGKSNAIGIVTDYNGEPWTPKERNFIASNGVPALHEAVVEGIRAAGEGEGLPG